MKRKYKLGWKNPVVILPILIILLGLLLRIFKFGQVPLSLYWDEVAILLEAKVLAKTLHDIHHLPFFQTMFASYGDYKLPVYIWLTTCFVKLLGVNAWVVRIPSLLAGIGTILFSGLLAKELFRKKLSKNKQNMLMLMVMLSVALSPWSILFSRTGFEGHLGQFFVLLSGWVLLWGARLQQGRKNFWKPFSSLTLLAPLLGGIATYTYFSIRFVWPVVFIGLGILAYKNVISKSSKMPLLWLSLGLLVFSLTLWPMVTSPFYQASNQFRLSTDSILNAYDYPVIANQYRELAGNTLLDRVFFHRDWLLLRELGRNFADNLSLNFLFVNGDQNLRHGTTQHGLFLLSFLPFLFIGLYYLFDREKLIFFSLLGWWMVALLPASVPETTPHALRSLNALVPISIILGTGLFSFLEWLENKSQLIKQSITTILFLIIGLNALLFAYHYFRVYPAQSAPAWQGGYKELALKIDQARRDREKTASPETPPIFIEKFDDRFYLWLLTFGEYSAKEIQNLPQENYQVTKLPGITFVQECPKEAQIGIDCFTLSKNEKN